MAAHHPVCECDEEGCQNDSHDVGCGCDTISIHPYCEEHLPLHGWEREDGGCWRHPEMDGILDQCGWRGTSKDEEMIRHRLHSVENETGPEGQVLVVICWYYGRQDQFFNDDSTGAARRKAAALPGYVETREELIIGGVWQLSRRTDVFKVRPRVTKAARNPSEDA